VRRQGAEQQGTQMLRTMFQVQDLAYGHLCRSEAFSSFPGQQMVSIGPGGVPAC
jgi:hypothetical protein